MRFLIIQPWIRLGGAELISVHLAYGLQSRGHDVAIACTFVHLEGMPVEAHQLNYLLPSQWLSRLCENSRLAFLLFAPWILFALVWGNARGADVINPHNFPSSWIAVLVGTLRRRPVIWTCNEPPSRVRRKDVSRLGLGDFLGWLVASSWLDKIIVKNIEALYVPSEKTRRQVRRRYGRGAEVIPIGVDSQYFRAGSGAGTSNHHDWSGKFVLLTVGKLHPQKNLAVCIEALKRILPIIPNAMLLMAGDGPLAGELRQLASRLGVDNHVSFLGHVSSETVRALYRACDINLFPATGQSWGLTPLEALCTGRISIVSNDCGSAELLEAEDIGIVSEPTAHEFASSILKCHAFPELYKEKARKGRDYVMRFVTWNHYTESVLQLFQVQVSLHKKIQGTHGKVSIP